MKISIPDYVTMYFWGDNLNELDIQKNQNYIIATILDKGNEKALHWLFQTYGKKTVTDSLAHSKISKKSINFWNIYLK